MDLEGIVVCVCVCMLVTQSCLTLCDPMDCSPPGSSDHGILQARTLDWVAIPFSRGSFWTQGLNPGLPHCKWILYRLSHQGSPEGIMLREISQTKTNTLCFHLQEESKKTNRTKEKQTHRYSEQLAVARGERGSG